MSSSLLSRLLEAYQSPLPADWVGSYRYLPTGVGILLVLVGAAMLLFGGGRAFRLVAGPMAAIAGFLWMPLVFDRFGAPFEPRMVGMVSGALLAAIGFALPPGGVFFAFGLIAGLAGGQLAGSDDWLLGFFPSFLLVGSVAAILHRFIGAVASALMGAWLICIGLLAALHQLGGLSQAVAARPWGVLVAALLFALAGSIYQLAVLPNLPERERLRQEKFKAKQRATEKKALEKRWANYSKREE
ncbi:MAG: TMEM198/TM7SF3 family protein [Myxococcota bacterium]|nr:TMEM198/TM7SF3 family protein [Myxococcota bacterium]